MKDKKCEQWILNPAKLSFRNGGEIKTFLNEGKWNSLLLVGLPLKIGLKSTSNRNEIIEEK